MPHNPPYLRLRVKQLAEHLMDAGACTYALRLAMTGPYERTASDFDSLRWSMDHNALVRETMRELGRQGYVVFREDQNSFSLPVHHAGGVDLTVPVLLNGKPDLVAVSADEVLVVDCKTGRIAPAHQAQVLLYQLLVPRNRRSPYAEQVRGKPVSGRVVYHALEMNLPADGVDTAFNQLVGRAIRDLAEGNAPQPEPSASACRFCDVASCGARYDAGALALVDEFEAL